MGWWGVTALDNDYALDWLDNGHKLDNKAVVEHLLDSHEAWSVQLGIAAVITSVKGVKETVWGTYSSGYMQTIRALTKQDYSSLVPLAKKRIPFLNEMAENWFGEYKASRVKHIAYLKKLLTEPIQKKATQTTKSKVAANGQRRGVFKPYTKVQVVFVVQKYFGLTKKQAESEVERLSACVVRDNLDAIKYLRVWETQMKRGFKGNIQELYQLYPFEKKYGK